MPAGGNDRAVWNRADENWRRTTVNALLEQSITGGRIRGRDRQRRVGVVVNLDEVVARSARSRSTELGDQEGARRVTLFDCSYGLCVDNYRVGRVRQVEQEGFIRLSVQSPSARMLTDDSLELLPAGEIERRFRYRRVIDSGDCMTRHRRLVGGRVMDRSSLWRRGGRQRNREQHRRGARRRFICLSVSD